MASQIRTFIVTNGWLIKFLPVRRGTLQDGAKKRGKNGFLLGTGRGNVLKPGHRIGTARGKECP
ncbi:MAG: hypothetical protein CM15mP22_4930 [Gammaproteobacteria bacterium]|nr:MAG: hypothetical protein CM15mP22_4930 [Gammaproteobacteria bacterium]